MNQSNATPPDDFPVQVIIMDKELAERFPAKVFYLRVAIENGVDHVSLDDAVTPLDARNKARVLGYEPTHWMVAQEGIPQRF
jgi:hypothetical protein